MELKVECQLNPRAETFVPTVKANKLLWHRRGKREEGETPVSKRQKQLGRVRWASRRRVGEPTRGDRTEPSSRHQNSDANGGRNQRADACTGRRGGGRLGSEECKGLRPYGRDIRSDNDKRLLAFSTNHELALLNTFMIEGLLRWPVTHPIGVEPT